MTICHYCNSANVDYLGAVNGVGPYGTSVCDEWECNDCGQTFEHGCISEDDPSIAGVEDAEHDFSRWTVDGER